MFTTQIRRPNEPEVLGQPNQEAALYDPTTQAGVRSYVNEAWQGVGTGYALKKAFDVEEAERNGSPINEDEYKILYDGGQGWYEGMTLESARIDKEYNDAREKNNKIIGDLSTGQSIVGFTAGFISGVAEPQNVAIGVATSLALGPLGELGVLGNHARRMYQLRKTALRARVGIGATEGVVAGALVEPTNRYSARTLQQDYTMADSLFNIATSTAFGAGLPVATNALGKAGPFMQQKIDKFRGRTMDVVTTEVDIATQQFTQGQRVDVSAVEAAESIKLPTRPESVKRIVNEGGSPVFHDTSADGVLGIVTSGNIEPRAATGLDKAIRTDSSVYVTRNFDSYSRKADSPYRLVIDQREVGHKSEPFSLDNDKSFINEYEERYSKPVPTKAIKALAINEDNPTVKADMASGKYDAVVAKAREAGIPIQKFRDVDTDNRIKAKNATTIAKHNAATIDPRNDTLIDYDAIDAMDERRAIQSVESEWDAEAYLKEAEAEIQLMLDQDILNEADLAEYQQALEELNGASTKTALETLHLCMTRG